MTSFRAFRVEKTADRQFPRSIVERDVADLPAGDLLIDVAWSSLNYKDGLSATGNPGVTRNFPHTPGIDAAGTVTESSSSDFAPGDAVVAIGFDLGMNTPGGFGQKIRIPAGWAIPMPDGLDARSSMILGTAGFTAALCVHKLEAAGMQPDGGPVLVTGATGGVGSIAVKLLAHLGYEVHAVTGKTSGHDFLRTLGARGILSREDALKGADRPLLKPRWGGAVDTVGGAPPVDARLDGPLIVLGPRHVGANAVGAALGRHPVDAPLVAAGEDHQAERDGRDQTTESTRPWSRPVKTTSCPCPQVSETSAAPMPWLAPVTRSRTVKPVETDGLLETPVP